MSEHPRDRERDRRREDIDRDQPRDRERRRERGRSTSRSRSPPKRDIRRNDNRSRSRSQARRDRTQSRSRSRHRDTRRRRSRSRSHHRHEKRRRSRSQSSVSTASSSTSYDRNRSSRKKDKHRSRRDLSRSRSRDRDNKKDKKRKKDKKDKKKKKKGASGAEWGKYGIISEADMPNKEPEFRTWLLEERMLNPETLSKDAMRKEFARFVEDFNTATLPHQKYYSLTAYDIRMNLIRSGEALPPDDIAYDPNADLVAHKRTIKSSTSGSGSAAKSATAETYMSREQLMELRKVQMERHQVGKMKAMGMDIKSGFGVRMDGTAFDE